MDINEFQKGDRVKLLKKEEWGIGEVLFNCEDWSILVFFVNGGYRRLRFRGLEIEKVFGKEASHPDLENITINKSELGIEEYFGKAAYIDKHSRPALLLSKVYESTGTLSFFGGKPIAPKGFDWPTNTFWRNTRCMPFLAQINLSDLDFPYMPELPDKGILYFFIDENLLEGQGKTQMVFYSDSSIDELHTIEQSGEPSCAIGKCMLYGGHTYTYMSEPAFPRRIFPKFEVRTDQFMDIRNPYNVYGNCMFEIGRETFDELEAHVQSVENDNMLKCLSKIHGADAAKKRFEDPSFRTARVFDPSNIAKGGFLRDDETGVSPLFDRWPQSWLHVGLLLSSSHYFRPESDEFKKLPDTLLKKVFMKDLLKWLTMAKEKGQFSSLTEEDKRNFLSWIAEAHTKSYQTWSTKDAEKDEKDVAYRICMFLEEQIRRSALDATSLCLDLEQKNRDLINEREKQDYLSEFDAFCHNSALHRHQMFGYGVNVQNATEENIDKILLLQLYTDYSMLWMFGDVGTVQYWISREDLANRRFDKVIVTLEGC